MILRFGNIYLVKALHCITRSYDVVSIGNSDEIIENSTNKQDIIDELDKLKSYNILKDFKFDSEKNSLIKLSDRFYQDTENEYIAREIIVLNDEGEHRIVIEKKTGKIVQIASNSDYFQENKSEVIQNFIRYLDLHIIDDWEVKDDNFMVSEKADLGVLFADYEEYSVLYTGTLEQLLNYKNYVEVDSNK